jgi:beta-apo-4'-carotenal oxygenase
MGAVDIPELKFTPVEKIPEIVKETRATFFQQKTRPLEFRIQQLRKLYWA